MKQIIYLILLCLLPFTGSAQAVIDGMTFYPNIDENGNEDGTCYLSKYEKGPIDVIVPDYVSIGEREYSVTKIGSYAFSESWNEEIGIHTVTLPNSIVTIEQNAFDYCMHLIKINLPEGLLSIENNAFNYCQFLTIDKLPSTLQFLGDFAFNTDTRLIIDNNLTIPASVTYIGKNCFSLYPSSLTFEYSELELEIDEGAFGDAYYLNYLEINRNLNVKAWAFSEIRANCNLTIGEHVTDISWFDPSKVTGLCQIVCEATTPPSIGDFTQDQYSRIKLFLLTNLKAAYENDPKWSFFQNIIELDHPLNEYNISIDSKTVTLNVGESVEIGYTLNPSIDSQVALTKDGPIYDNHIVNVNLYNSTGMINGGRPGETNVAFTLMLNNKRATCHITVLQPATNIILNKNELTLEKGETATIFANVAPIDVSDSSVTWISTNSEVATVEEGIVKAIGSGVCQIIASTHNGLTAECTVMVNPILVESIEITPNVLEAEQGESIQLIAIVLPEYATNKEVEWSSDDDSIAEISMDGLVKIISPGITTIRAKSTDNSNIEGVCEITGVADVGTLIAKGNHFNLYTADGVLVFKNVSREQILQLAPGIYIVTDGTQKFKFIKN